MGKPIQRKDYDGEYQLALLLTTERSSDYFHVIARPVKHYVTGELRGRIRGIGTYDADAALDDLQIYSQGSNDRRDQGLYAWEVEYQPHTVRLARARSMADTLLKIQRRLAAIANVDGPPKSFGQYVNRVGRAIGADHVLQVRLDNRGSSSYDEHQYSQWTLGDAVGQIDWLIHQWQEAEVKVQA